MKPAANVRTVILLFVLLASLLLLASSLSTLEFSEGNQLPISYLAPNLGQSVDSPSFFDKFLAVFRVVMIIAWVLLPVYAVYLLISKEARKRLLRDLAIILPILLLLYFVSNNISDQKTTQDIGGELGIGSPAEVENQQAIPLPEFQPPPQWVTTVVSFGLATALVIIMGLVIWTVWRRTRQKENDPLTRIEFQAREAIELIEAGGDLREVIQRCYKQMIIALRDYRLISRDQDMTPHEFGQYLAQRGLPSEPVSKLTELFEQVRYGGFHPGRQEERAAIASLSAIVSVCRNITPRSL